MAKFVMVSQAAKELGLTTGLVNGWVARGLLRTVRVNTPARPFCGARAVDMAELRPLAERHKAGRYAPRSDRVGLKLARSGIAEERAERTADPITQVVRCTDLLTAADREELERRRAKFAAVRS